MKKTFLFISLFLLSASALAKDVSAYLIGAHATSESVKSKLSQAGFEVIAEYSSIAKGTTIVFTNEALKAEGNKPTRAHAAVLRVFVDDKKKSVSITNPVYFGKAFMQDDYDEKIFEAQLTAINGAFKGLKGSVDKLDEDDLSGYHFMIGMPYYDNFDELATGSQEGLIKKITDYKKGKNVVFSLKLSDESTLVGYDLSKRTKRFVKKIGRANAAILPYCVSIEDGVATALAPKYYLAVCIRYLAWDSSRRLQPFQAQLRKI